MRSQLLIGAVLFGLHTASAQAQLLNIPNPDEVCRHQAATFRKTIVYVDLSSVRPNETEWGLTLLNKLELGPRETITLLGVNPSTYEINDVFDSCYPTLTSDELSVLRANRGVWDSLFKMDPDSQQKENIQTFDTRLRNALDRLIEQSKKVSIGNRKNILGAISVDKNRFRDPSAFYRLILYTDGTIVDPQIPDQPEDTARRTLAEKYPAVFAGAEAYVYGVTGKERDRPLESKEKMFATFFLSNWGWLRSFSPSLPQQVNDRFESQRVLTGTFDGGNTQGPLKLVAAPHKDRSTSLAWLAFTVGAKSLFVPFQGDLKCNGDDCNLIATALEDIPVGAPSPYFRKSDVLNLAGKVGGPYEGTLRSAAREVFRGGPEVQYKLKLNKP